VVLLGIKLDRFTMPESKEEVRARMVGTFAPESKPRIVLTSVGRLVPRKGVAWFVENVMPKLPDDVHFYVAGEGPDRPRIEAAVSTAGIDHRVRLPGAITDSQLETLYQGADLFMMPNVRVPGDMEGFGLVMLEAGLCGVPVIASNIEGIADVVAEGENGHLAESGNAESFREAIMRYHGNPAALAEASARARLYTVSKFGWGGVTERYLEVLEALLESARLPRTG
jgi:phosphatidylinositol alpha-1,6-mannosyltransferase